MKRNKLRKEIFNGERHIADLFITDKEIVVLMEIFTKVFYLFISPIIFSIIDFFIGLVKIFVIGTDLIFPTVFSSS